MRVKLLSPPWGTPQLTMESEEAVRIIGDDVWKEASVLFSAERDSRLREGKSAPKGMQRYLNEVLDRRFLSRGWKGDSGYYFKNKTWVRITFRHQMSLGSDFLDAIKVCKIEKMEIAIILAANRSTLDIITPNDAAAIVSFEKLEREVLSLNGAIDIPLLIGELTPQTVASKEIDESLRKKRLRDVTVPSNN